MFTHFLTESGAGRLKTFDYVMGGSEHQFQKCIRALQNLLFHRGNS